jgi:xylulokinase
VPDTGLSPREMERSDTPALIGIDAGSSSVRAIAFDREGRKLAVGQRRTPMRTTETGGEYDPDAVFDAALAALCEVGQALNGRPVAGIAVTSIGESCVLVDAAGRPVAPTIAWFDQRTWPQAHEIEAAIDSDRVFHLTGHAVVPIFTLLKLKWMREHWPEAAAKARNVMMMAEWIAFRLTGVMAAEPMLASRTLYFDIRRGAWSDELLALAGFDASLPPPLTASGTPLGAVRPEILAKSGLAGRPVVAVGGHDHIIGAMTAGLLNPGTVVDSVGTAEGFILGVPAPLSDPETIRRGYVQGMIDADRRMIYLVGSIVKAGGAMDWLRAILGNPPMEELIAEATAIAAGSGGAVFLPHLGFSPPPEPDEHGHGAFIGLTPLVGRAALYRAVLEGLAMQGRRLIEGMTGLKGATPVSKVSLIGGASRNPLFVTIKANVLGRPIEVVDEPETTALGAALMGGVGAGVFPDFDTAVAGLRLRRTVIEPDATAAFYDDLCGTVFARIHERLGPLDNELDRLAAKDAPA